MADRSSTFLANIAFGGGVGFAWLLTVLFIGLKLTGYIDWLWWWVLSPALIIAAIMVIILVIASVLLLGGECDDTP